MQSREQQFTTNYVMPWIRAHKDLFPQIVFEAKETNTTIGDNNFEDQQLPSLRQATTEAGITFKIPDGSGIKVPFDGIHISNAKAFVAVLFRGVGWCLIDVHDWDVKPKERMSWDDCKIISNFYYYL